MLVNTQWTIQLSHKHRSILCCSALEGFRSWLLLWNVIRDLESFANPAIPHFVPPAHVVVVIAKTKSIWGNNRVGASTSVFRIFKAYCFERGCKSRFGWSFLLRFFPKEKHNTGEESKRAKKTKQCLFSAGGWEQLRSAAEMIIRWPFQKMQKWCEDCIQNLLTIKPRWTGYFGNWAFEQKRIANMYVAWAP